MQELARLLAASAGGEARSRGPSLERGIMFAAVAGVFALACAFAVVGFLAAAVFFETLPDYGAPRAACFAALAAAIVMVVLGLGIRRALQPEPPPERASPLAGAAQATPPKTIWDVLTLVIAGVVAGLSQKR